MHNRPMQRKKKRDKRKDTGRIQHIWPILFVFMAGLLTLLYPIISEMWNRHFQQGEMWKYDESIVRMKEEKRLAVLEEAHQYNAGLLKSDVMLTDPFDPSVLNEEDEAYEKMLSEEKVMAYLKIPTIDVELPIYHGTSEEVLEKAVGHLHGSSLPVGGTGTHCVLSAHNGLPTATLFTNLDQVDEGDWFSVTAMGETLYYLVDQIQVVEPGDTNPLAIDPKEDYVTLVTCTPYGVNSHRLLVRGVRTDEISEDAQNPAKKSKISHLSRSRAMRIILYGIAVGIALVFLALLSGVSLTDPSAIYGKWKLGYQKWQSERRSHKEGRRRRSRSGRRRRRRRRRGKKRDET